MLAQPELSFCTVIENSLSSILPVTIMPEKRARKPLSEVSASANTVPKQKRQKLTTPKERATATASVDFDDAVTITATPKAPKTRKR